MFASTISFLSWNGYAERHWTAMAFAYASIACSLTAIVLGAQQLLVLSDLADRNAVEFRDHLTYNDGSGTCRPRRTALYIWQIPIQCLAYSVVAFIVALLSFVFSPLAMGGIAWNGDAKVSTPWDTRQHC
jgi:hypothetical protein